ncbi:hypothetical protein [Streptomyces sp. NPDC020298]|uniref:hypothetical protein n=1 Tax=unclassified Streptomyces TaxID=2593676 RepID=UPI0033D9BE32
MATQTVTLVGVLIGALTSYLATATAERAKFWLMRAAREALRARSRGQDTAEAKRSILFESFILLSDEAAADAAHTVNQRAWELLRVTRDPSNGESALADVPLVTALNTLHDAARSSRAAVCSPCDGASPAPCN